MKKFTYILLALVVVAIGILLGWNWLRDNRLPNFREQAEIYVYPGSTADEVLEQLANIEVDVTQNWNRRYRENMLRIKSGDLLEVARVIKCLMLRDSEKGLSTGDRKMLRSAKQILISELVLSKNSSYEEVEEEVNAALA